MSDPAATQRAIDAIRNAARELSACPYRRGNELLFPAEGELLVTGDLHGDVESFSRIVEAAALESNPFRHLLLQELVHGRDSMDNSASCRLVEEAAALVNRFPARVHILMGNHEMAELTGRVIMKEGVVLNQVFNGGAASRYENLLQEAIGEFRAFWRAMPLAARTSNRVFISHSTPSRKRLAAFDRAVLRRPLADEDFSRDGGAAYALLWGRDFSPEAADEFARIIDVDFFVVGHTPCPDGFAAPNSRHVILDSQGPSGKYLLLPLASPLTYAGIVDRIRPIWS